MRVALVVAAALLIAVCAATPNYKAMFENFKKSYGRKYASAAEESKRFGIFVENMIKAQRLHKMNPLAVFGVNEFADVSADEFKIRHSAGKYYAARKAASKGPTVTFTAAEVKAAAGEAIDWRTKGAVTGVKNQNQCGSCWAFSSTGSIEGQWFLAGNTLTSVSEQELVSCDTVDQGCNGGLMDNAWTWLMTAEAGKIVTEASYPYVSGNGEVPPCDLSGKVLGSTINGHKDIAKDETQMAAFVYASGPLSIAVDATSFQTYSGGILTNCISQQIDHGVLIVGFDDTNNPPYWIIKNSWGASWGESGYIRVEKGTDQCLITTYPCSSTVAAGPGPGPTPPTPPGPSGDFEQKVCSDDKCQTCVTSKLPQGQCIKGTKSGSFKATCLVDGLLVQDYTSSDCSGSYQQVVNPINQCSIVFVKDQAFEWVENVCGSGPGPSPPTTTAPGSGSLIQEQCTSSDCSSGCTNYTFPLNKCLQLQGGGSATAQCNSQGVLLTEYISSTTCTGPSIPDQMAVNQCLQDTSGTYFENFCIPGAPQVSAHTHGRKLRHMKKE